MLTVADVWLDAKKVLGLCDESTIYRRLTDAVELLANKSDWDPLKGFVDICTSGDIVTLPREVETIVALNMEGRPALGRSQLYNFHLNGPGDETGDTLSWQDLGEAPTYRELVCPAKLVAIPTLEIDGYLAPHTAPPPPVPGREGAELWVYGYDESYNAVRTEIDGVLYDGYRVPVIFGTPVPPIDAPTFARITRVRKSITNGSIRLSSIDAALGTGTLVGVFEWDETDPIYRRIRLDRACEWVRIAYRKRTFALGNQLDRIPLHNRAALVMALRALKLYDDLDFERAMAAEATAVRWLEEEQRTRSVHTSDPIQVTGPTLVDKNDWDVS